VDAAVALVGSIVAVIWGVRRDRAVLPVGYTSVWDCGTLGRLWGVIPLACGTRQTEARAQAACHGFRTISPRAEPGFVCSLRGDDVCDREAHP
jgi:hypothetical protein